MRFEGESNILFAQQRVKALNRLDVCGFRCSKVSRFAGLGNIPICLSIPKNFKSLLLVFIRRELMQQPFLDDGN